MNADAAPHGNPDLTRNQALVFSALEGADGPLSAYTILDQLRDDGLRAPLQIYRALDKLVAYGLVHRVESLNAFVACNHPTGADVGDTHGAAAFAICERCDSVAEFTERDVADQLRSRAKAEGFEPHSTVIELRGLCESCRTA
ncbi:MAG: transcriptional repressor [Alphaproteobacteria bacterium]|mgnify:CR=1 FL=1|nr:transcriptional repressor [Alphaproteobacteria bacterium]HCP01790.1 transcriptional repressor [Rhodospirillaceae bacterium]